MSRNVEAAFSHYGDGMARGRLVFQRPDPGGPRDELPILSVSLCFRAEQCLRHWGAANVGGAYKEDGADHCSSSKRYSSSCRRTICSSFSIPCSLSSASKSSISSSRRSNSEGLRRGRPSPKSS